MKPDTPIVPRSLEVAATRTTPRRPSALDGRRRRRRPSGGVLSAAVARRLRRRRGQRAVDGLAVERDVVEAVGVDAVGAVAAAHGVGEPVARAHVVVAVGAGVDVVDAEAAGRRRRRRRPSASAVVALAAVDACRRRRRSVSVSAPVPPSTSVGRPGCDRRGVLAVGRGRSRTRVTPAAGQKAWIGFAVGADVTGPARPDVERRRRRSGRGTRSRRRRARTVSVFSDVGVLRRGRATSLPTTRAPASAPRPAGAAAQQRRGGRDQGRKRSRHVAPPSVVSRIDPSLNTRNSAFGPVARSSYGSPPTRPTSRQRVPPSPETLIVPSLSAR